MQLLTKVFVIKKLYIEGQIFHNEITFSKHVTCLRMISELLEI